MIIIIFIIIIILLILYTYIKHRQMVPYDTPAVGYTGLEGWEL